MTAVREWNLQEDEPCAASRKGWGAIAAFEPRHFHAVEQEWWSISNTEDVDDCVSAEVAKVSKPRPHKTRLRTGSRLDAKIDRLYASLQTLLGERAGTAHNHKDTKKIARLFELIETHELREAARLRREFQRSLSIPVGEGKRSLREMRALIRENTEFKNRAVRRPTKPKA